jgi:hypothetical protein
MKSLGNTAHSGLESGDDDSPFLSIADFFSLISLALIYSMIVFAPQSPVPEDAVSVLAGRVTNAPQNSSLDPRFAAVTIEPTSDGYAIEYSWPAEQILLDAKVSGVSEDVRVAIDWLNTVLATSPSPDRIIFMMDAEENRPEAHRLFNKLAQAAKAKYPVSTVFLSSAGET